MNNRVLSLTLPILLFQLGQSFISNQIVALHTLLLANPDISLTQLTFNNQESSQFLLAARDDKKKECRWVGSCDDEPPRNEDNKSK